MYNSFQKMNEKRPSVAFCCGSHMLLFPFITEDNYYSTKLAHTLAAISPSVTKDGQIYN